MRSTRGITLIALIVTVVVMLILLSVSVVFVMSDDGIINDAQYAKNQVEEKIHEQNQWTQNIIEQFY